MDSTTFNFNIPATLSFSEQSMAGCEESIMECIDELINYNTEYDADNVPFEVKLKILTTLYNRITAPNDEY